MPSIKLRAALSLFLVACAVAPLAACSVIGEGQHPFHGGWRKATIIDVGVGPAIKKPAAKDCRTELPAEIASTHVFARVVFGYKSTKQIWIMPVGEGSALKPGDTVFINTHDCGQDAELRLGLTQSGRAVGY